MLLLRLGQEVYLKSFEESTVTLDLLSRLVTFNMVNYFEVDNSCLLTYCRRLFLLRPLNSHSSQMCMSV